MKKNIILLLFIIITFKLYAQNPTNYKESLTEGISYDMAKDSVLKILGRPDSVGDNELWGATGNTYQEWKYSNMDLSLIIETVSGTEISKVYRLEINHRSALCTSKGVCIGSSKDFVIEKYGDYVNKILSETSMIIVGNEYEGVYIYFENEKVVRIVLGYVAE